MAEIEFEDRELFEHLVAEFGGRGRDAIGFLWTSQQLVAGDAARDLPRGAGAAAYCIREALKRLLPPDPVRFRGEGSRMRFWMRASGSRRFEGSRELMKQEPWTNSGTRLRNWRNSSATSRANTNDASQGS